MQGKDIYKIWVKNNPWNAWVRPVPFAFIDRDKSICLDYEFNLPKINYLEKGKDYSKTAIVLDLPDDESIKESLSLIDYGFIPVPVFNGTNEQEGSLSCVNNHEVLSRIN